MEKDKLLDHDYDGIKELDNPLPRWWLLTFYGAIVFAALYFFYYHIGDGPTPKDELSQGLSDIEAMRSKANPGGGIDPKKLQAYFQDSAKLHEGKELFLLRCASCHGQNGEGNIGPNLTDKYWIHGDGSMPAIAKVVVEGVADKGMPPWGAILKSEEIHEVVAYVKSLHGTNPANPKAAQGTEVKE